MAAVGAMMPGWVLHGDLPPAGGRVILSLDESAVPARDESAAPAFPGYTAHWVQSGTAALALGLMVARARRPELQNPSVILPAYGCPDLIAAAEYAGMAPVLVDIGVDDPGYDLDSLAQSIDENTVAVVAVNFLGIRERLSAIRALLAAHSEVLLIEDNAQWFPEPLPAAGLVGDLVCMSFGRGKPVSLLGGGVLLVRENCKGGMPTIAAANAVGAALVLKARLFNALLHRRLYPFVNRNPLFELGKTELKPLREVRTLDALRRRSVLRAAQRHLAGSRWAESAWRQVFPEMLLSDSASVDSDRCGRLLRYPILCRTQAQRDALWQMLDAEGLGASAMYRVALPEVKGVAGKFRLAGDYPNARDFAGRLLTLPVHEGVERADIDRAATLQKAL